MNASKFSIVSRDINKTVTSQSVESAKAEERMLNMDFVTAKAKELSSRRERAEVRCDIIAAWTIEGLMRHNAMLLKMTSGVK